MLYNKDRDLEGSRVGCKKIITLNLISNKIDKNSKNDKNTPIKWSLQGINIMRNQYDNSVTVADEERILEDFNQRSQETYRSIPHLSNCSYLSDPLHNLDEKEVKKDGLFQDSPLQTAVNERTTYDLFLTPKQALGTIVFIHGGYWQWCHKSDFAFIAPPILQAGYNLLLLEYPLAPTATLSEINRAIKVALDYFLTLEKRLDLTKPTILAGHSAGAHLASLQANHPLVDELWLLSGIYQLQPIAQSHLNQALQLTPHEIEALSPQLQAAPLRKKIKVIVGQEELPELIYQSLSYYQKLFAEGAQAELLILPSNHYTILETFFSQLR